MKDFLTKLRILRDLLRSAYEEWHEQIWKHDLGFPLLLPWHEVGRVWLHGSDLQGYLLQVCSTEKR